MIMFLIPIYNVTVSVLIDLFFSSLKVMTRLINKLIKTTLKEGFPFMRKIQITSHPNALKLYDKIYVHACRLGGLVHLVRVYTQTRLLKNQWLAG